MTTEQKIIKISIASKSWTRPAASRRWGRSTAASRPVRAITASQCQRCGLPELFALREVMEAHGTARGYTRRRRRRCVRPDADDQDPRSSR
jgi:hypothetical protein